MGGLLLWVPPLAAAGACVALALAGSMPGLLIGVGAALLVAAVYVGAVVPIGYGLGDKELVVRFGLCRVRVPLEGISEVRPTRNPLSAPALSLARLRVADDRSGGRAVMISPADRDRFLGELSARAGLTRDGERLVRR